MAWVNLSGKANSWKTIYPLGEESVTAILLALCLVLAATLSIREHDPPAALSATVSPQLFSAGRAVQHLPAIANEPHPMGSTGHRLVQQYLLKQLAQAGLEPQLQLATVALEGGPPLQLAAVENVAARLKGTATGKALLLVAHYDSEPNSFGASDDGAAVASLLETLRALKAGAQLKNDVIFLFTDGEENGLLGARAFLNEHPWAKDVGVVLNFDARGNTGPVIMFETSDNNGWLIEQFAEVSPVPIAHSLSYELYKLLPNDTDMTPFKRAGVPGLNFANIDGIVRYHTPLDNLQGVDDNTIQHQGSYALALADRLGNLDLSQVRQRNVVYFDLFGKVLVRYSTLWVLPLTLAIVAMFAVLIIVGLRRQKLTVRGIARGFLSMFVSLVIASMVSWLLWKIAWMIRHGPSPEAGQSRLLLLSFVALAMATTLAAFALLRKQADTESLAMGALLWWLILMVVTSIFLPGATFIFHWPLLFSLIAIGWMILGRQTKSGFLNSLILGLCALPGIILIAPVIYQVFVGLTLNWSILVTAMVVLLLGLLLPHLRLITTRFEWVLPGASAVAAIVLLVIGVLANAAPEVKSSNRIYYALNADTGKAVWATTQPDERASQFFNGATEQGTLADFGYKRMSRQYTLNSAPVAQLPAPEMTVLEDRTVDGVRVLRIRVSSMRQAGRLFVYVDSNAEVLRARVNNSAVSDELKDQWGLEIDGMPEKGVELQLEVKTFDPLRLRLIDESYGLPAVNAAATQQFPTLAEKPDLTLLVKSFTL